MSKQSAGILLYRKTTDDPEFFLVHPGGPFWVKKDMNSWSIPKGEFTMEEEALAAARREFEEETGSVISGKFLELSPVKQKGGKTVFCFAVEGDIDPDSIKSNLFEMEWPPRSGRMQSFPEADKAAWFGVAEATGKILEGQKPFLEELLLKLKKEE